MKVYRGKVTSDDFSSLSGWKWELETDHERQLFEVAKSDGDGATTATMLILKEIETAKREYIKREGHDDPIGRVLILQDEYRNILIERGNPDPDRKITLNEDGSWEYDDPEKPMPDNWRSADLFIRQQNKDDPVAIDILLLGVIELCKKILNAKKPESRYLLFYQLGSEITHVDLRLAHSKTVQRGLRVAGGARNSAHQTNQRHAPIRERRFSRIRELMESRNMSLSSAAHQCEREGLGNAIAILKQWSRHKSKDT